MQPTARSVPSSARALITDDDQRNVGECGRQNDGPQLMCTSLGGLKRRRLRAALTAVALDVGTKRWQTLILT
jgi:hypothetical protein